MTEASYYKPKKATKAHFTNGDEGARITCSKTKVKEKNGDEGARTSGTQPQNTQTHEKVNKIKRSLDRVLHSCVGGEEGENIYDHYTRYQLIHARTRGSVTNYALLLICNRTEQYLLLLNVLCCAKT
jgi:hypothetical protein